MLWLAAVLWLAPAESLPRQTPVPRPRLPADHWRVEVDRSDIDRLDLQRLPGGGYRHVDEQRGFVAEIHPDGSVEFEQLHKAELESTANNAREWAAGFIDALMRPPGQRDRPDLEFPMPLRDDASARAAALVSLTPNTGYPAAAICAAIGLRFSVRPTLSYATRSGFLRRTQVLRDSMAIRWHRKQLEKAALQMSNRVVRIWKDESVPLSVRKREIFELWDDAEPAAGSTGPLTEALESSTSDVRRKIERAIRHLAPRGSEQAFTQRELTDFNAMRVSVAAFQPYRS